MLQVAMRGFPGRVGLAELPGGKDMSFIVETVPQRQLELELHSIALQGRISVHKKSQGDETNDGRWGKNNLSRIVAQLEVRKVTQCRKKPGTKKAICQGRTICGPLRERTEAMKPRHSMKFGGTSVGDALASPDGTDYREGSKESGLRRCGFGNERVTNRLIEAAKNAQAGNTGRLRLWMRCRKQPNPLDEPVTGRRNARGSGSGWKKCSPKAALCEEQRCFGNSRRAPRRDFEPGERLSAPLVAA